MAHSQVSLFGRILRLLFCSLEVYVVGSLLFGPLFRALLLETTIPGSPLFLSQLLYAYVFTTQATPAGLYCLPRSREAVSVLSIVLFLYVTTPYLRADIVVPAALLWILWVWLLVSFFTLSLAHSLSAFFAIPGAELEVISHFWQIIVLKYANHILL